VNQKSLLTLALTLAVAASTQSQALDTVFYEDATLTGQHNLQLALAGDDDVVKTIAVLPAETETANETMKAEPKVELDSAEVESDSATVSGGQQRIQGSLSGMIFVPIPGGSFRMGSNNGDNDEAPVHTVQIDEFSMMTTEVTQQMWKELMGSNSSFFKGDDLPVEDVSWYDAQEFIKKLNQRDPGKGYRLPSESEWEYACRAGTITQFNTGDGESDLGHAGWYNGNSDSKTHPVGQKAPNVWGLYDMHGNVWEWCEDWYHSTYNGAPADGRAWVSPKGSYCVLRGGSWGSYPRSCRSTIRYWYDPRYPGSRYGNIGFRVAASFRSP
jgi:formylglycine-generating enzyme required for sulfatase activity